MLQAETKLVDYDERIESALDRIAALLNGNYGISRRTVALLLLQEDQEIEAMVRVNDAKNYPELAEIVAGLKKRYNQPLNYLIALKQQQQAKSVLAAVVSSGSQSRARQFTEKLSRAMINPWTGGLILVLVLYLGLYQFVGVFGAGFLVGVIEGKIFGEWINLWFTGVITNIIPWQFLQDLFIGTYGIFTLGLTYAFALILPIVSTFFIAFSIIEDSGYLPRMALLVDGIFKKIGLSGRAVIPMVLGFGCDTMATIVTRTQETKRERVLTTLLLALAIPCSAQLGVIFAILSGSRMALVLWAVVMMVILLVVGYLAAKVIPGERASFYIEVPPLRLPSLNNVLTKTYTRLKWYFIEVLPVFVLASFLLWVGDKTGLLALITSGIEPLVKFIGLPAETAEVFLYGFFRRDFGAAGLYNLHNNGVIFGIPLLVSAVTLTLFVPCVAQFSVMIKERGLKTALAIAGFIFPFAFLAGFVLDRVLTLSGIKL